MHLPQENYKINLMLLPLYFDNTVLACDEILESDYERVVGNKDIILLQLHISLAKRNHNTCSSWQWNSIIWQKNGRDWTMWLKQNIKIQLQGTETAKSKQQQSGSGITFLRKKPWNCSCRSPHHRWYILIFGWLDWLGFCFLTCKP